MILNLLQISDSFFPTGSFTHSYGLETLVQEGRIGNSDDLREFLEAVLRNQIGPCDLVFMQNSYRYIERAEEFSRLYSCFKTVPEFYTASLKIGKRLLAVASKFAGDEFLSSLVNKPIHYPLAFGVVCRILNISLKYTSLAFMYCSTVTLASAAIRLLPLGHDEAQKIIHSVKPVIEEVCRENEDRCIDDVWQFSPELEVAGFRHEKLYSRLFLS